MAYDKMWQHNSLRLPKDKDYEAIIDSIKVDTKYEELGKLDNDHPSKDFGKLDCDKLDDLPNTLIIYDSNKVVVPREERHRIMKLLHISHGKAESTISKARLRFYWPHMRKDITNMVATCKACAIHDKKQEFEPPVIDAKHIARL